MKTKMMIYQVLPRLFGNASENNIPNGTIKENGSGKFNAFTNKALAEIKKMGFTHLWYTGILAHASKTDYSAYGIPKNHPDVVKGIAGSPYSVRDYYDVDPDLAESVEDRMSEFEELIQRTHAQEMKVIIDFIPNHVAREYHSIAKPRNVEDLGTKDDHERAFTPENNFYYLPGQSLHLDFASKNGKEAYHEFPAKVTGNDRFDNHPGIYDWYETIKLNYGIDYLNHRNKYFTPIPDTWFKMRDILLFWAEKGVDGFRCDMAEMVPVEFWSWIIPKVKAKFKHVTFIAEIYNPDEYANYIHAGRFDYLYDKVGLYDTLKTIINGERPSSDITRCWQSLNEVLPRMLNFLENHDEQRIASDFFAKNPLKAIPALVVSATFQVGPFMIYAGQELGEAGMDNEGFSQLDGRTTIYDYWSVASLRNWYNKGKFGTSALTKEQAEVKKIYTKILQVCATEAAIAKGLFFDLMYANYENPGLDPTKQYAFMRGTKDETLLIVSNFDDKEVEISLRIPDAAFEYLSLEQEKITHAKDLLSGKKVILKNGLENFFECKVEANRSRIFKFLAD